MSASQTPDTEGGFNLSAWALSQQSLVVFMMIVTLVAGALSYMKLSRNEDPPFTIKTMVVSAFWPGATVTDATKLLTDKLEQKLEETPHLDRLDSYTRDGESVIMVHLRDDTPPEAVDGVWYQVRKKIADITPLLPRGVVGPFFNDEFGDTFGIIYGLTAEGFSERELRDRLDHVRADVLTVKDVGKVQLIGVQEEQIMVEFSARKLAALGLDTATVIQTISAQNSVTPSGTIRLPEDKVSIRVSGAFSSEESLKALTLRVGDRTIPLTEIAQISRVNADPPSPLFRINGEKALGLAISMAPQGNLTEFGEAVKAKMAHVAATLPHGIELVQVADQPTVVKDAIWNFIKVLLEAIGIVLAVSFLSLGMRAGLVVAVSIPFVLAMTFVGMDLADIGLQRISLGALIIALGLLVDDAMITVETMVAKLEEGWSLRRAASFAYESTAFPMLTGTLVMIAGFIPVGFAASSAGEYCYSLFMVVLISLSASWIVAVLFSPLIGVWMLPKTMAAHGSGEGRIMKAYGLLLHWVLDHRKTTIAATLAALALSGFGATKLEQQFFPASDRNELLVSLTLPQNASLDATNAAAAKLEAVLKTEPTVQSFSTYVGSGAIRFYLPMDVLLTNDNIMQTVVVAKGLEERDALRHKLEELFKTEFAGVVARATPLELGPPVGWPLKYRVTGPDPEKVREVALQVANLIGENPSTRDVNLTAGEPQRTVRVMVKQDEARAVGLSSESLAETLATMFSGATVTSVREGDRMIEVKARATEADRTDLDTLANLQIATPGGRAVPLSQIATLTYGVEDPVIWRRQRVPVLTVQADVVPSIQPATVSEALKPALAAFAATLPSGYEINEGGVVEEASKGNASIMAVVPAMLLAMIALLMVQLRSFLRVGIALFMAPFALIGVVSAMLPTGTPMGFVAQLGVIALAGMIIRNAVILIEEADLYHGRGEGIREAIVHAAKHRARPIVLTACAAILGMIPIAPQIFWGPMAYAIIGGLAVATVLTLTLLPVLLTLLLEWETERASGAVVPDLSEARAH